MHAIKRRLTSTLVPTTVTGARDKDLGSCGTLISPPEPTEAFNSKEPTLKEVEEVMKVARSGSAPGLSGVPYVIYKRYP